MNLAWDVDFYIYYWIVPFDWKGRRGARAQNAKKTVLMYFHYRTY